MSSERLQYIKDKGVELIENQGWIDLNGDFTSRIGVKTVEIGSNKREFTVFTGGDMRREALGVSIRFNPLGWMEVMERSGNSDIANSGGSLGFIGEGFTSEEPVMELLASHSNRDLNLKISFGFHCDDINLINLRALKLAKTLCEVFKDSLPIGQEAILSALGQAIIGTTIAHEFDHQVRLGDDLNTYVRASRLVNLGLMGLGGLLGAYVGYKKIKESSQNTANAFLFAIGGAISSAVLSRALRLSYLLNPYEISAVIRQVRFASYLSKNPLEIDKFLKIE